MLDEGIDFVFEAEVDITCLWDSEMTTYSSYAYNESGEIYAPFPIYVVIDHEGIITYISRVNDPEEIRLEIAAALAKVS